MKYGMMYAGWNYSFEMVGNKVIHEVIEGHGHVAKSLSYFAERKYMHPVAYIRFSDFRKEVVEKVMAENAEKERKASEESKARLMALRDELKKVMKDFELSERWFGEYEEEGTEPVLVDKVSGHEYSENDIAMLLA